MKRQILKMVLPSPLGSLLLKPSSMGALLRRCSRKRGEVANAVDAWRPQQFTCCLFMLVIYRLVEAPDLPQNLHSGSRCPLLGVFKTGSRATALWATLLLHLHGNLVQPGGRWGAGMQQLAFYKVRHARRRALLSLLTARNWKEEKKDWADSQRDGVHAGFFIRYLAVVRGVH